jgi:hypothetical protein
MKGPMGRPFSTGKRIKKFKKILAFLPKRRFLQCIKYQC